MKGHRFDPGPGHLANDEVASAPFLTSFDRTAHEARDEVLTQGDVHHNGRQTGNEHTSHDLRIIRVLSGSQRLTLFMMKSPDFFWGGDERYIAPLM